MHPHIPIKGTLNERQICSKERPFDKNNSEHLKINWSHPNSIVNGSCFDECCDDYKCLICNFEFRIHYRSH